MGRVPVAQQDAVAISRRNRNKNHPLDGVTDIVGHGDDKSHFVEAVLSVGLLFAAAPINHSAANGLM